MLSDPPVISLSGISKSFHIYERPQDRLKQMLFGASRKYYREFWALQDINLNVKKGEALALVGRNGAGKSTLLEIISSVLTPTSGTVVTRGRIAPLLQLGTSFNPEFTGQENISIAARVLGLSDGEIAGRESSIVDFAELGDFIHQPVRTYSSGMSARLAFAIAAHVSADILVVDEVLSVGDIGFSQKCARFLRDFRDRGTLLFVSHDIGAVLALCDRAIWVDHGRIVEDAEPKRVIQHYATWIADPSRLPQEFLTAHPDSDQSSREVTTDPPLPDQALRGQPGSKVEISPFNHGSRATGLRNAKLVDAWFESESGNRLGVVNGGEIATLVVRAEAEALMLSPIIGFGVLDRLGQTMFAWDTSKDTDLLGRAIGAGQRFTARFRFVFPYLVAGSYSVVLALADGSSEQNVQQHWMYEAMIFQIASSNIPQGLFGVPMLSMSVTLDTSQA